MILRLSDEAGPFLTGRSEAAELRKRVAAAAVRGEVVIDLAGIEVVSPSFADEFFAKLPAEIIKSGRVRFEHLTPDLGAILRTVMAGRAHLETYG